MIKNFLAKYGRHFWIISLFVTIIATHDFLYDEGKNAVYEKVFSDIVDTPIVKNELGDSAGVFGACMI